VKNKKLTMIYGICAIGGAGLLTMLSHLIPPVIPLLMGLFCLPILLLTALRQYSLPAATLLWLALSATVIMAAPSVGWGVLMAAVWFAGAMILRIGSDLTFDLFSLLFYGGIIYLGLIFLGVALTVKDIYGVYDFKSAFNAVETPIHNVLVEVDQFYREYLTEQQYQMYFGTRLEQVIQNTENIVYELVSLILVLLSGWLLFTLKIAQNLCRLTPQRIKVAPITLYGVPREIAWCYLILFAVSLFIQKTVIAYPFEIALTLTGFMLVPAGVGVVDGFMRKWHPALRTLLKTLMLVLAFAGYFYGTAITYTVLMAGGLYISLFRQIIFHRIKKGKDDE